MPKLCVKVGGVIKKLDLDGGGSVPSTGANSVCTTYYDSSLFSYTNTSHTMEVMLVSSYESSTAATITNGSTTIMEEMTVHDPGKDGGGKYPGLSTSTFILLKGDKITFTIGTVHVVSIRVVMP